MRLKDFKIEYGLSEYCARQQIKKLLREGRIRIVSDDKFKTYEWIVRPIKAHDPFNLARTS